MTKHHAPLLLLGLLLTGTLLLSCGSGGSSGPAGPIGPGELTVYYCRVIERESEIHVEWAADAATRGEIRYGRTSFTNLVNIPARLDTHDVVLSGLDFNTRYIYRVNIFDSLDRSAEFTGDFTTPVKSTPEPIISGLTVSSITETSARINWRTDEPATTILYYGVTTLSDSVTKDSFALQHEVILTDLIPSTSYRIRPEAVDSTNLRGFGRDSLFTTATRMTVSFPDTTIGIGDTVRLPIWITNAQDLAALRLGISFTSGTVEVVAVDEGPFYTNNGGFIIFSNIRNSEGFFVADLTWTIQYQGNQRIGTAADGSGIVAYARLRGVDSGPVEARFRADSTFGLDVFAQTRACSLRAGVIEVQP
ncbi:hypothetical protein EHM69_02570 [candidate division KSB1 bacterium]|nr:MAG: hypothetical protein EHM69_02570 [candidate division KSB1 bacterium]